MALSDPTFSRAMFRRPGLNIADVTSGILNGIGGPPPTQVAGQRLQVASADPGSIPPVFGGAANPLAGLTDSQLVDEYTQLESLIRQAEAVPPGAESGVYSQVPDLSAQIARFNMLEKELNNRDVLVESRADEVAGPGLRGGPPPEEPSVDPEAINQSAAVARGEVPTAEEPTAEAALTDAQATVAAVTGDIETEDDFNKLLKALGPKDIDYSNWKKEAKELLGVSGNEADVPEWAAPIFLFGLNLMKGPVSSQTGQQGLGGLLADVGAAGEVGFQQFAVERARKQARREKIGSLALSMMNQDKQTRIATAQSAVESQRWWAEFQRDATKFQMDNYNKVFDRWAANIGDPEDLVTFAAEFNALASLAQASGRLGDPVVTNLIGAVATERAGIRTPLQIETLKFGHGIELNYSKSALKRLATQEGISEEELLSAIIANPTDPKYAGVAVSVNMTKNQFEDVSITENGVTIPRYENIALRDAELAAAQAEKRDVNPEVFRIERTSYLEAAPNFKRIELGNVGGVQKYAYMDFARLGLENQKRRKAGRAELTMAEILRQPRKYPGIISPEFSDTSGALDNISIEDIYTGPNSQQKFIFNRNLLDKNRTEVAEALGISVDEVNMSVIGKDLELMEQLGILVPTGDEKVDVDKITIFRMGSDGTFSSYEGRPGDVLGAQTQAAQDKVLASLEGTENVNNMAFRVFSIYDDLLGKGLADDASSAFTGILTGLTQVGRLTFFPNLGRKGGDATALARLRGFDKTSDAFTLEANNLIDGFETNFDAWAKDNDVKGAARQKLKTIFIDMAFSLASAREAGKLTDNDVRWAFETLGFDTGDFLQSPGIVVNGLREAVTQINQKMERRLAVHADKNLLLELEQAREGLSESEGVFVLERMFRDRQRHVAPTESNWGRTGVDKRYRVDHFLRNNPTHFQHLQRVLDPGGGVPEATTGAPAPTPASIQYMGKQVPLIKALSPSAATAVDVLGELNIPRTSEGFEQWFNGLTEDQRMLFAPAIAELDDAGFWDTQ